MPRNLHKRQRKLAKQKAKRKAEKKAVRRLESLGKRGECEMAAGYPVLHCCEFYSGFENGLTQVLFSRRLSGGNVAFAMFLVDHYCVGVKDVYFRIEPERHYVETFYDKLNERFDREDMSPEAVRKLVESAVEYARDLGISPHADYPKVAPIFGDVDPSRCDEEFEFGNHGRPCFVRGPFDSEEKMLRILATLEESCGPGNFDLLIMTDGKEDLRMLSDEEFEELEFQPVDDDRW